jgi:hypothetical protein
MSNFNIPSPIVTSKVLTGLTAQGATTVLSTDSILIAFGKLQAQVTNIVSNGGGTVTSVGLSLPVNVFTVSNSPVNTSGTLTAVYISQNQNTAFMAPSNANGTPSFRLLVAADIPNLDAAKITTGQFDWNTQITNKPSFLTSSSVSGSTNVIAKFTSANAVGNSRITDNGTTLTLNIGSYTDSWNADYISLLGLSGTIVRGLKITDNSTTSYFIESGGATYGINTLSFRSNAGGSEKFQFISNTNGVHFDIQVGGGGLVRSYKKMVVDGDMIVGNTALSGVLSNNRNFEVNGVNSSKIVSSSNVIRVGLFTDNTSGFGLTTTPSAFIGTETNHAMRFVTNGTVQGIISATGIFGINTQSFIGTEKLRINGGMVVDGIKATSGTYMVTVDVNGTLGSQTIPVGGGGPDTFLSSATFNTVSGLLTLTKNDASNVTVSLEGRYLTTQSNDIFNQYASPQSASFWINGRASIQYSTFDAAGAISLGNSLTLNFNAASNVGSGYCAINNFTTFTVGSNEIIPNSSIWGSSLEILRIAGTANATVTFQGAGGSLKRSASALNAYVQFAPVTVGLTPTVSHVAAFKVFSPYQDPNGTNWTTVQNFYGIFIEDLSQHLLSAGKIQTKFAIYQEGSGDNNYFGGNIGVNNLTPQYDIDITGDIRYSGRSISTPQLLSIGSGTAVWNLLIGTNGDLTLVNNANTVISITNAVAGVYGTIILRQSNIGNGTITLPAGSKVVSNGGGAVTLSTTAFAVDILSFYYDGSNYFWTYGKQYS